MGVPANWICDEALIGHAVCDGCKGYYDSVGVIGPDKPDPEVEHKYYLYCSTCMEIDHTLFHDKKEVEPLA